jgi:hypothetical protein
MEKSQNPQFKRFRSKKEQDTLTIPTHILYDQKLTGNAVKLLLIIFDYGNRPNWVLRQGHLISQANMGWDAYQNAITKLIEAGYVRRTRGQNRGILQPYEYEYCIYPELKTEPSQNNGSVINSTEPVGVSLTGGTVQENPDYTSCYKERLGKETTPAAQENGGGGSLSEKEKQTQQLLKNHKVKLRTLKFFATQDEQVIKDAVAAFDQQLAQGLQPVSVDAYLRTLIKDRKKPNAEKIDPIELAEQNAAIQKSQILLKTVQAQKVESEFAGRLKPGFDFRILSDRIEFKKPDGIACVGFLEEMAIQTLMNFCKTNLNK